MMQRLLTTPLLAAGLLLSTLGCSKKEEPPTPTPTAMGTGSYKLDAQALTCQAQATTSSPTSGGITRSPIRRQATSAAAPRAGVHGAHEQGEL